MRCQVGVATCSSRQHLGSGNARIHGSSGIAFSLRILIAANFRFGLRFQLVDRRRLRLERKQFTSRCYRTRTWSRIPAPLQDWLGGTCAVSGPRRLRACRSGLKSLFSDMTLNRVSTFAAMSCSATLLPAALRRKWLCRSNRAVKLVIWRQQQPVTNSDGGHACKKAEPQTAGFA